MLPAQKHDPEADGSALWRSYSLHHEVPERRVAFLRDAGGRVGVV